MPKSAPIQRSPIGSYTTVGSPWLSLSHGVPVCALDQSESNVSAARRAPLLFEKMPIDVLTTWMKCAGPTSPFVSGGQPAPQFAESSPAKLVVGAETGALGTATAARGSTAPGSAVFGDTGTRSLRSHARGFGRSC